MNVNIFGEKQFYLNVILLMIHISTVERILDDYLIRLESTISESFEISAFSNVNKQWSIL